MFKSKKANPEKSQKGFTIIEVMIVLAIAGLILLIVFLAIPALQRNSRNTQRKNDASNLASLISEWESNNAGTTPTGFGTGATQVNLTGQRWAIITAPTTVTAATGSTTWTTAPAADTIQVNSNTVCNGNTPTITGATARSVTVWYGLEGNTPAGCVQA